MKKKIVFLLVAIVLFGNAAQAQVVSLTDSELATIQEKVLFPFFEALKYGDVLSIKKHISSDLYARNRVLLEENSEYPAFLKNYYSGINFRVISAEKILSDEVIIYYVSMEYSDGNSSIHELKLSKENRENLEGYAWVIENF